MGNQNILKRTGRWVAAFATCALVACGGNYSNEDIEFQTSVPSNDELTPRIAAQLVAGSAESYKLTYGMVNNYRQLLGFVAKLLDHVRRYPATTRSPDGRIWGPFSDGKHPAFAVKVTIERMPGDPMKPQFTYSVDFAAKAVGTFAPVIYGTFDPQGAVGEGNGRMTFDVDGLRLIGYPVGEDISEIRSIVIDHARSNGTRSLVVHQTNLATAKAPTADLTYQESPDGSAFTHFVMALAANLWMQEVDVVSAWRGDGAGRGEIKVTSGLATGLIGTDCWGPSTLPTFVKRDWDPTANQGDPASCVLPPLR